LRLAVPTVTVEHIQVACETGFAIDPHQVQCPGGALQCVALRPKRLCVVYERLQRIATRAKAFEV
jgi:hypothetical protein